MKRSENNDWEAYALAGQKRALELGNRCLLYTSDAADE